MHEVKVDVKVKYDLNKPDKAKCRVKFHYGTDKDDETYDVLKNVDKFADDVYKLLKRR